MVLLYFVLDVTASCSSSHEIQVISGTYRAKGVFNDHIIYEKTVADVNGNWWSLRFDKPTDRVPATNQWIFSFTGQRVTVGESIFGSTIENINAPCNSRPG